MSGPLDPAGSPPAAAATSDSLADLIERAFKEGRGAGLGIRACAEIIAGVVRGKLEGDDPPAAADRVDVQAVVSHRSGDPLVQCRVGAERWQWEPQLAREHAMALLTVAEAAVHDAAMVRWLTLSVGMERDAAFQGLVDLRRFRGDVDRQDWRPGADG